MCLIAYQPAGSEPLPFDTFENGWKANADGAGYMFAANGELVIRKPFYKLRSLLRSYRVDFAKHGASSAFVLHFRYATHGVKNETNTHPHLLDNGKVGLVHNGILSFEPPFQSKISDTVHFCRTVLAYRNPADLVGETLRGILAEMIGTFNKLVLMDNAGNVSIVNEDAGQWEGSTWYSNGSYLPRVLPCCPLPAHYRKGVTAAAGEVERGYLWSAAPDVWDEETGEEIGLADWNKLSEAEWQERFLENELDEKLRESA
jgi:hypothetical protein